MRQIAMLLATGLIAASPAASIAGDEAYLDRAIFRAQLLEVRPVMDDSTLIRALTAEYAARTGKSITPDQLRSAMVMDHATLNSLRQGVDPSFFRFAAHRHQVRSAQAPEVSQHQKPAPAERIGMN